jgi:Putative Actinobacterial Holin-X, holin superfamily III
VAENVQAGEEVTEGKEDGATESPGGREGLPRFVASLTKVADLQFRIWMTRLKITALRMGMYFAMFGAAAVLGFLAIVFLYIGGFKVLTDVLHMRAVWAFVLFGGVHLIAAMILIYVGVKIITGRDEKKKKSQAQKKAGL